MWVGGWNWGTLRTVEDKSRNSALKLSGLFGRGVDEVEIEIGPRASKEDADIDLSRVDIDSSP
jgi:hypothetical protein